jgi:hypothetical protein
VTNINLSGSPSTGTIQAPGPGVSLSFSGVGGTDIIGSPGFTLSLSVPLSGDGGIGNIGTLGFGTVPVTLNLTGISSTAYAGDLAQGILKILSGNSVVSGYGIIALAISKSLTGDEGNSAAGYVFAPGTIMIELSGVEVVGVSGQLVTILLGDIMTSYVVSLLPKYETESIGLPMTAESICPRYTVEVI